MYSIIILIFVIGYVCISLEHIIKINKSAIALVTAGICWSIYISTGSEIHLVNDQLLEHLADASGILFFLLGAMTIVELIDNHDGFEIITNKITTNSKRKLLWIVCLLTFFMSAILDNLTTTIVMLSLIRKLISGKGDRLKFAGMIVIAANAGGAWSPIGDVTTTMLWIGNQITAYNIIYKLILPSLVCLIVPLTFVSLKIKGTVQKPVIKENPKTVRENFESRLILALGLGSLLFVPVFKTLTHLPPFMGMLMSLGILWSVTEIIHKNKEDKDAFSVSSALQKIDTPSILFFLGILLAIGALQSTGQLTSVAEWLTGKIHDINLLTLTIGVLSAIVDNVPLVAAAQGMFSMVQYPTDHYFWEMIAYTTGTGGSILIIGSASGVIAMGIEKINFIWYLKRFSLWAFVGYLSGAVVYILQDKVIHLLFS